MHARRAVLRPADVQTSGVELDLMPLQITELGSPEAVTVGDQDHARVPMAPAASLPSRRHQLLDLGCCEVPSVRYLAD